VPVLLLNLVLDTLVAAYTKYSEEQEEEVLEEKVQGILNVFRTVSRVTGSRFITRQTFMDFCEVPVPRGSETPWFPSFPH
jgi:translation initiation factor IF-2